MPQPQRRHRDRSLERPAAGVLVGSPRGGQHQPLDEGQTDIELELEGGEEMLLWLLCTCICHRLDIYLCFYRLFGALFKEN